MTHYAITLLDALDIAITITCNAIEYEEDALAEHLRCFGETTQKNQRRAQDIREDIRAAKEAKTLFESLIADR